MRPGCQIRSKGGSCCAAVAEACALMSFPGPMEGLAIKFLEYYCTVYKLKSTRLVCDQGVYLASFRISSLTIDLQ
jgi:hypothetical protein